MLINTQYAVEPYVTSSFSEHGLLATTGIMSSIIAGVSKLTIAKIMDIWGRVEGYGLVLVLLLMGKYTQPPLYSTRTDTSIQAWS